MVETYTLVQGDDFNFSVTFKESEETQFLIEVFFSCQGQKFSKKLSYAGNNQFVLNITGNETKNFTPKMTDFDITIKFIDGETFTPLYHGNLQVLRKNNSIE